MLRACVGLLIVVIWQAGRPDRVCQGWAGQEGSTAEANWKASCHAKAVKVCASALACRRVTGTYPPPSSFPPRPCSLRHHTTPHAPPRTHHLPLFPTFLYSDARDLPTAPPPPLLLPAYRRHGFGSSRFHFSSRGSRGDAIVQLTRESSEVRVKSGSSQVMVLWPRRGGLAWHRVCYTCLVLSPPVIDVIGQSVNRSVCRSVRLHHGGLRAVAWGSGDVCRVEYCMDGKTNKVSNPIQSNPEKNLEPK